MREGIKVGRQNDPSPSPAVEVVISNKQLSEVAVTRSFAANEILIHFGEDVPATHATLEKIT